MYREKGMRKAWSRALCCVEEQFEKGAYDVVASRFGLANGSPGVHAAESFMHIEVLARRTTA